MFGLAGEGQGADTELLSGLQGQQVGAFFVDIGQRQLGGARFQRIHVGVGEVQTGLQQGDVGTQCLRVRAKRRQRAVKIGNDHVYLDGVAGNDKPGVIGIYAANGQRSGGQAGSGDNAVEPGCRRQGLAGNRRRAEGGAQRYRQNIAGGNIDVGLGVAGQADGQGAVSELQVGRRIDCPSRTLIGDGDRLIGARGADGDRRIGGEVEC